MIVWRRSGRWRAPASPGTSPVTDRSRGPFGERQGPGVLDEGPTLDQLAPGIGGWWGEAVFSTVHCSANGSFAAARSRPTRVRTKEPWLLGRSLASANEVSSPTPSARQDPLELGEVARHRVVAVNTSSARPHVRVFGTARVAVATRSMHLTRTGNGTDDGTGYRPVRRWSATWPGIRGWRPGARPRSPRPARHVRSAPGRPCG